MLAEGAQRSGVLSDILRREFGISQPGVSQHLRILREYGLTSVRAEGTRRVYSIRSAPLEEIDAWLDQFRGFWVQHLQALSAEADHRDGDGAAR
nr:ArsR family transcriptional regulator [Micromonospora sp. HNM0581]